MTNAAQNQTAQMKRTDYLRGISSSAPERTVNVANARHKVLEAAFEQVQDRADWKGPINALIQIHTNDTIGVGIYMDAVEYFTGSKPELFLHSENEDRTVTTFRIVAEGYRLAQG